MLRFLLHSYRALSRRPLIHLIVVGTLALGIGAATTVFSLVHGVLLAPLPFPDSARLMRVFDVTPEGHPFSTAPPTSGDIGALEAFDAVGAMSEITEGLVLSGSGSPTRLPAAAVSASLLRLLQMPTAVGRTFTPDADLPGSMVREAVISYGVWTTQFGRADDIVGRVIRLNDAPFTVVGVFAAGVGFPDAAQVWVPLSSAPTIVDTVGRDDRWLAVVARLQRDRTEIQARDQLRALSDRLAQEYPEAHAGWQLDLVSLQTSLVSRPQRLALWTLAGAVACLLLLACANVAGLLLIEAIRRDGEFRLRAVLGASATRLGAQLLLESAVLAAAGALLGIGLSYWLVDVVRTHAGELVPHVGRVSVDGTALLASLALAALSCLLIGTAPGLRAATLDLRAGLDGAGQGIRTGKARFRRALVVLEVGLALVLLAGAALMATSFSRLAAVDSGLDVERVVAVPLDLSGAATADRADMLLATLEARLAERPEVVSVGATTTYPWRQFGFSNSVTPVEQAATAPASGLMQAQWRAVTPGFFRAAGVAVLRGDVFPSTLRADDPRVVVVSKSLADRLWPGADPIGRQILWGGTTGTPRTVIGVVGDIRDVRLDAPAEPMLLVPHIQTPVPAVTLLLKARTSTTALMPIVREAWQVVVPNLPAPEPAPLADSRSGITARPRLVAWVLAAMAGVGSVLATTGIYALLAFAVVLRRRELAVRLALGSTPAHVTSLVVTDGLRLAGAGIVVGMVAALAIGDLLVDVVYGVAPHDPMVLGVVSTVLLMAAAAASYLPARSAARTDPARVLREG